MTLKPQFEATKCVNRRRGRNITPHILLRPPFQHATHAATQPQNCYTAAHCAQANHNPLVVIPGGPGLSHNYLETLEGASKDDRVVVLFDPIGTGNSTALPENAGEASPSFFGTRCLVAQVMTLTTYRYYLHRVLLYEAVGLDQVCLFVCVFVSFLSLKIPGHTLINLLL